MQDGVRHKELKEITTVKPLCNGCNPYKEGKCPCMDAKGPPQTVLTHECRIGDKFYKVSEVIEAAKVQTLVIFVF